MSSGAIQRRSCVIFIDVSHPIFQLRRSDVVAREAAEHPEKKKGNYERLMGRDCLTPHTFRTLPYVPLFLLAISTGENRPADHFFSYIPCH